MITMFKPKMMAPSKAAKILGLTQQHVAEMCRKGKFPGAYQLDNKSWVIPNDEVQAMKKAREKAAKEKAAKEKK